MRDPQAIFDAKGTAMTEAEVRLQDDKMRAEIGKLLAETAKLQKETRWYEALLLTGALATGAAIAKLFF